MIAIETEYRVRQLLEEGVAYRAIARMTGVSVGSVGNISRREPGERRRSQADDHPQPLAVPCPRCRNEAAEFVHTPDGPVCGKCLARQKAAEEAAPDPIDLSKVKWTDNVKPVAPAVQQEVLIEAAQQQRVALLHQHMPPHKRGPLVCRPPHLRGKEVDR